MLPLPATAGALDDEASAKGAADSPASAPCTMGARPVRARLQSQLTCGRGWSKTSVPVDVRVGVEQDFSPN